MIVPVFDDLALNTALLIRWLMQDAVALTASGGATPSDTSDFADLRGRRGLSLFAKNGASTSLTVSVYASPDNVNYDTAPIISFNLGANESITRPINGPVNYVKVTAVNGDAVNATSVTTIIVGLR